jgi:hypothetical protein
VDLDDEVPILILDVLEADVAEDTGVVDQHIDAAESLDGGLDDALAVLDGIVVGNGLAAGSLDLVDNNIGSLQNTRESVQVSHGALLKRGGGEGAELVVVVGCLGTWEHMVHGTVHGARERELV